MDSVWIEPDYQTLVSFNNSNFKEIIEWLDSHPDLKPYKGDLRSHRDEDGNIDLQADVYISYRMVDHEQTLFDWLYLRDNQIIIRVNEYCSDFLPQIFECWFFGPDIKEIALMFALTFKGR